MDHLLAVVRYSSGSKFSYYVSDYSNPRVLKKTINAATYAAVTFRNSAVRAGDLARQTTTMRNDDIFVIRRISAQKILSVSGAEDMGRLYTARLASHLRRRDENWEEMEPLALSLKVQLLPSLDVMN